MKLPIGLIARFALKIATKAIAKAATNDTNPLTVDSAKKAVVEAVQDEMVKAGVKRLG